MRKTWFHGLAMTLGVSSIPTIASAQYTVGDSVGLAASSFNARALPPLPPANSGVRNYLAAPAAPAAPAMHGQNTLAGYSQNGPVGSGVQNGHVHVPSPVIDNNVLNTQYQEMPQQVPPAPQYDPIQNGQNTYIAPQTTQYQSGASSCAACNSGNCQTHGVGHVNAPMISTSPTMTYGGAESCYSEPAMSVGPSIVSPNKWIFGASGLLFNRLDNQNVRLTTNTEDGANPSPTPNPYIQSFLNTSDAKMQTTGGVQFNAGRYFGDGRYAIIGSYWGIFSNPNSSTIFATDQTNGNLRSNLPLNLRGPLGNWQYGMSMPVGSYPVAAGPGVYDWFDGARAHRILRDQEFHSAELNFFSFALGGGARQAYAAPGGYGLGGGRIGFGSGARSLGYGGTGGSCGTGNCGTGSCGDSCQTACSGPTGPCAPWYGAQCSKLRLNTYGGVRWFRFKESLEYAASHDDTVFNGGADDFYYRNGVTNDLVGFQLGSLATWCTGTRFNLFGGGNFGVYGNRMQATTFAGSNTQTAALMSQDLAFDGRPYNYSSTLNDVAFLGEGTLGTGVRISRGWTANVAYRLVGVSGVATAVGQIPRDFSRGDEITRINNNNSLLLHGVSLGANYNF